MKILQMIAVLVVVPLSAFGYTFDRNVPENIRTQITEDMNFISQISGGEASYLHGQIFGAEVTGAAYQQFFESRVHAVGMNNCGSSNAVACVIPWRGSSKIWLTQNYVRFEHPEIARLMIVFHEARHTEVDNGNWAHATCPVPFVDENGEEIKSIWTGATLAGEPACDDNPWGSYASSMIMLKNISKFCTNCTEKVLMDAGIYADDQFKRVVNEEAKQAILQDLYATSKI